MSLEPTRPPLPRHTASAGFLPAEGGVLQGVADSFLHRTAARPAAPEQSFSWGRLLWFSGSLAAVVGLAFLGRAKGRELLRTLLDRSLSQAKRDRAFCDLFSVFHSCTRRQGNSAGELAGLTIEVKQQMARLELSGADIATQLGISEMAVSYWRLGKVRVPERVMAHLRLACTKEEACRLLQGQVGKDIAVYKTRHPHWEQVVELMKLADERGLDLKKLGVRRGDLTGARDLSVVLETVRHAKIGEEATAVGCVWGARSIKARTLHLYQEEPLNRALQAHLRRLGLGIREGARALGISHDTLAAWVSGRRKVPRRFSDTVVQLTAAESPEEIAKIGPLLLRPTTCPPRGDEAAEVVQRVMVEEEVVRRVMGVIEGRAEQIRDQARKSLSRLGVADPEGPDRVYKAVSEAAGRVAQRGRIPDPGRESGLFGRWLRRVTSGQVAELLRQSVGMSQLEGRMLRELRVLGKRLGRQPTLEDLRDRGLSPEAAGRYLTNFKKWGDPRAVSPVSGQPAAA